MEKLNRRDCNKLLFGSLCALMVPTALASCDRRLAFLPPKLRGTPAERQAAALGMVLGVQTYSFRDRSLEEAITAMRQLGITSCELWNGHVEPRELKWEAGQTAEVARQKEEALRRWRDELDLERIRGIKKRLDDAGISIIAYTTPIKDSARDYDIDATFRIARALGTDTINTSAMVSVMKRLDPFARRYRIKVAMHNHAHVEDPNEIATPDSFERGMAGLSDYIAINLDIGHFTAANFDAVDFIRKNHDKILSIHIKDRKRNQGPNKPLGEGDTPIGEVLRLIRDNKWPIPANIEYEYAGGDTVAEVGKCLAYCKKALA